MDIGFGAQEHVPIGWRHRVQNPPRAAVVVESAIVDFHLMCLANAVNGVLQTVEFGDGSIFGT